MPQPTDILENGIVQDRPTQSYQLRDSLVLVVSRTIASFRNHPAKEGRMLELVDSVFTDLSNRVNRVLFQYIDFPRKLLFAKVVACQLLHLINLFDELV